MKLLHQNPAPALLTGHSPPAQPVNTRTTPAAAQPRFGALPPNAIQQFISDTLGVWAPKVPITRTPTQFFEDAFLELVEDGAFYFTLPVVGPLLGTAIAKGLANTTEWDKNHAGLQDLAKTLKLKNAKDLVGHPMQEISEELKKIAKLDPEKARALLRPIVATKAGALIGTIGVAAGFEFMIQHTKNVITAKGFKTKNFAAVAGLEKGNAHTQEGQTDPVEKAKKRGKQVGAFVLASLAAAFATPLLLKEAGLKAAQKVMHVVDCTKGFDISKPILAMVIGTGVASYLDAARDPLEKKETGTRLCVVVPYLLFGKELAGYGLAKFVQRFRNVAFTETFKKPIENFVTLTDGNPLKKMIKKETLLQFNVVKNAEKLAKELKSDEIETMVNELKKSNQFKDRLQELKAEHPGQNIQNLLADEIREKIKNQIIVEHGKLDLYSYLLGALGCGVGMNWIIYKQTQARYKKQQEAAKKQAATPQQPKIAPAQATQSANAAFQGWPPAGTRPAATAPWQPTRPWPTHPFAQPYAASSPFGAQAAQA